MRLPGAGFPPRVAGVRDAAAGVRGATGDVRDPSGDAREPLAGTPEPIAELPQPFAGIPEPFADARELFAGLDKSSAEPNNPSVNMIHDLMEAPPVPMSTARVYHEQSLAPAKILIVDDREDKLIALESVLSTLGENIILARTGREALREILNHEFAVILMDVFMPAMDGFETAAMIRQRAQCANTPIIFITSVHNTDDLTARGYSLGAVDYIFSPIVPDVLRTKIGVFLELYRKNKIIEEQSKIISKRPASMDPASGTGEDRLQLQTRANPFFMLSPQLLAVIDGRGLFRRVNPAWEHHLGFIEDELRDKSILTLVHNDDWEDVSKALMQVGRGAPTTFNARHRCKSGGYRKLAWTVLPFVGTDFYYIFARDLAPTPASKKLHIGFSRS
ncbi:MAG: sensor hybrid histidine kinase [Verrucomicrobiales bacterium]|nr:sensor hybrid histidine kinase [Verrucomicrobiales bacterium]